MAVDFVINRGDTFPNFKATLESRNETTGKWEPLDLTLATSVTLLMTSTEPATLEVFGTCLFGSTLVIPQAPTTGFIEYAWVTADTEVANIYRLQFEVLWSNGKRQSIPNNGYYSVEIQPDLAGDP
jgi:hypothetical protein